MPTKVSVNSGQITINDGSTFLVTDSFGLIDDNLSQGFFVNDTRLISYYEVSINRDRLLCEFRIFWLHFFRKLWPVIQKDVR